MNPLYQAVTAADDEAYIELAKFRLERTYSTKRFRRQLITYCLLVIVYYIINGSLLATLLVSLVLFAASLWSYIGIRRPAVMDKKSRALAEKMIKKAEESNGGLETRYDFYQDMMNWENSHARGSMEYSDISEITEYSRRTRRFHGGAARHMVSGPVPASAPEDTVAALVFHQRNHPFFPERRFCPKPDQIL